MTDQEKVALAIKTLCDEVTQLEDWAAESRTGGWSTHQTTSQRQRAAQLARVVVTLMTQDRESIPPTQPKLHPMLDLKQELLPTGWRVIPSTEDHAIRSQRYVEYPNTITLESILAEVKDRASRGYTPLEAFLTVADGVRNWSQH